MKKKRKRSVQGQSSRHADDQRRVFEKTITFTIEKFLRKRLMGLQREGSKDRQTNAVKDKVVGKEKQYLVYRKTLINE